MQRVWVPHAEFVWLPGFSTSDSGNTVIFKTEEAGEVKLPKDKAAGLALVHEDQLQGVPNICDLAEVTEGAVLHTVSARYSRKDIYTRVARILIAANPFTPVPIFGSKFVDQYAGATDSMSQPPHIFGIGSDVVRGLREGSGSQAVLVSGESGAGKTESTKLILSFLTEAVAGCPGMSEKILSTNPVLESFGNAMTVRNNNSSRFGKWLEINVSDSFQIQGCNITDYLLELTRVINQGKLERNYHFFFQLMAARDDELLKGLDVQAAKQYRYLQNCRADAPGIDDKAMFAEFKCACSLLGLSTELQRDICILALGILTLGNCDFAENGDAAELRDEAPINRAAQLLRVDAAGLRSCLLTRKIKVGAEVTETPLKGPQAHAARDALARLLYGRLFKWLISRINAALMPGTAKMDKQSRWFGVLDIAGFESFEHNSLEQLFINLGNEKLQAHFNGFIFQSELADYEAEGISVGADMNFQNNLDILELLDGKGGILSQLEEEAFIPKATDMTFVSKVTKVHEKHKRLVVPKMGGRPIFGVQHFAGTVTYSCEGFLEKTIDKPPDDARSLLESSSMDLLRELYAVLDQEESGGAVAGAGPGLRKTAVGAKRKTVSSSFRSSLKSLMAKLGEASPHFVRCVKPNAEKVPFKFTNKMSMEQLLFSGIMEAVKIRQAGFPTRMLFAEFFGRYRLLVPKKQRAELAAIESDLEKIRSLIALLPQITQQQIPSGALEVGKRKVFAKAVVINALEAMRPTIFASAALEIQRVSKGWRTRRDVHAAKTLVKWLRETSLYSSGTSTALGKFQTLSRMEQEVARLDGLISSVERQCPHLPVLVQAGRVRSRMMQEVEILQQMNSLLSSLDAVAIDRVLARAEDLKLSSSADVRTLRTRSEKLQVQFPLKQAMEGAIKDEDMSQLKACMEELKSSGLASSPEQWLPGLEGEHLASRVFDTLESLKQKHKQQEIRTQQQMQAQASVFKEVNMVSPAKKSAFIADDAPKKSRKTITGLSAEDQMQLLLQLQNAAMEYDAEEMNNLLAQCSKQGVNKDQLAPHQELFAKLQKEDFLLNAMQEVQELIRKNADEEPGQTATDTTIKQLQNLATQLQVVHGDDLAVQEAETFVQSSMRARAKSMKRRSVFDTEVTEELDMAIQSFDLAKFPNLKKRFRGHRGAGLFKSGRGNMAAMVSHTGDELKEALTMLPTSLEYEARQTFRDILGWMHDRPVPQSRHLSYSHDIVRVAKSSQPMTDEVYCQVMKQLTGNPSQRSALQGWKLLLLLCQEASPSPVLLDFVGAFLTKSIREFRPVGGELLTIARQCFSDLRRAAPEQTPEGQQDLIDIAIILIDQSTRKVRIRSGATLVELAHALAAQIRLHQSRDFCFFQLFEASPGVELQRLLPMKSTISGLLAKWAVLEQKTKKASRLLWKRPFIDKTEALLAGDALHAALTYRQVLRDYLHNPICEDTSLTALVAANLMFAEGRLGDEIAPNMLEQIVPEHQLKFHKDRRRWSKDILAKLSELRATLDPHEPRLQKMSRVLVLCQHMKLFGSLRWFVKQSTSVPEDRQALKGVPDRNLAIHEKRPDAEYWLAVTRAGLSFVPFSGAPDETFHRKFVFGSDAMDRVVRWGYKQEILQLVLTSCDKRDPAAGVLDWTVYCTSPSALDICYAIEVANASSNY